MADVIDQDGKKPAETPAAEATPQQKQPRTLRLAEIRAAADRARSEVPGVEAKETPTESKGADGAAKPGGEVPVEGAEKPTQEVKPTPEGAKADESALDPKDPSNPFWKTQLGRHIREQEAATTAAIAELKSTITLLKAEKKELPKPSDDEAALERELGLDDSADKTATDRKPAGDKQPADDQATAQAKYAKVYLANNAVDEYRKDPMFGEIQALMFNKNDKENTYNRAWTENPDADYRINFTNAKNRLLEQKLAAAAENPPAKPGEGNLKGETPAAPLGVGGDVKITDGRTDKPITLDSAGQKYLDHIKRKGRDPEKVLKRAFAVDLSGASRSASR